MPLAHNDLASRGPHGQTPFSQRDDRQPLLRGQTLAGRGRPAQQHSAAECKHFVPSRSTGRDARTNAAKGSNLNPEVALVLRMAAEISGEKLAEGGIGKIASWRRRRRIAHLLASDADLTNRELRPVIHRMLDAEDLEIHVFRAACTCAARTGSFVSGDDPVRMDGADVSERSGSVRRTWSACSCCFKAGLAWNLCVHRSLTRGL